APYTQLGVQNTNKDLSKTVNDARSFLDLVVSPQEVNQAYVASLAMNDLANLTLLKSAQVGKRDFYVEELSVVQKTKSSNRLFSLNMRDQHLASNWNNHDDFDMQSFEDPFIYG